MLILDADDINRTLSWTTAIDAMDDAFRAYAAGRIPPPERLDSYLPDGEFHVKAGHTAGFFAVKANSAFFANPPVRPAIQGVIVLFDSSSGEPVAALDSSALTAVRTAAASAVATGLLAPPDAHTIGLVGAGAQAWHHARALAAIRPLSQFVVWSRTRAASRRLAHRIESELARRCAVVDRPRDVCRAEIVVTCTPSTSPILEVGDVEPGTLIVAVGCDSPHKQELSSALTASSVVVPDVLDQCLTAGELHHAVRDELMSVADVGDDLGTLLLRDAPPVSGGGRPVVFDSTGTGFQDAAAAKAVYSATLPSPSPGIASAR
ncbi:ornithine cyclodeaminase family protein [Phytoactinopolyspora limicola]|uniref:ornithine cyclodeaminase family protein n=1 Tax=Phytoactinopolyspora limicola TaxID=2715536 RepID=UPI00140D2FA4|nr:ornithine cyclodeaminase family protein [Phytoactinopolyspora limicola]